MYRELGKRVTGNVKGKANGGGGGGGGGEGKSMRKEEEGIIM